MNCFPGARANAVDLAGGGKGRKRRSVRLLLTALGLAGMSMVLLVTDLAESVSLATALTAHRMLAAAGLKADLDVERPGLDQLEVTYIRMMTASPRSTQPLPSPRAPAPA